MAAVWAPVLIFPARIFEAVGAAMVSMAVLIVLVNSVPVHLKGRMMGYFGLPGFVMLGVGPVLYYKSKVEPLIFPQAARQTTRLIKDKIPMNLIGSLPLLSGILFVGLEREYHQQTSRRIDSLKKCPK